MKLEKPQSVEACKYDEWQVKDAAETLIKADEIRQDSKMMGLIAKYTGKKIKALQSIQDLRDKKKELDMDE